MEPPLFLSPPSSKRPLMSDSSHSLSSTTTAAKRAKPQPPPLPIPTGHASLRMLCHASLIGGFIGKSGSSIKTLQVDTGSKIRVEDSLKPGSDDRVIVIVAPNVVFKKIRLRRNGDEVEVEVSAFQEAAIRVFGKVMEISGEVGIVCCRVLVDGREAGSVIGKGGKSVEKLRRFSGAKIRVLLGEHLPPGVNSPDEVVEIEGDVLAVKKALVGVCGHIQECTQAEKSSIKDKEYRPLETVPQPSAYEFRADPPHHRRPLSMTSTSYSPALVGRLSSFEKSSIKDKEGILSESIPQSSAYEFRADPTLHQMPLSMPTTSYSPALVGRLSSFEPDRLPTPDLKLQQQEIVFKILCSNDRIGGVIGRGGSIIKALQEESGASINVGSPAAGCNERLITVSSKEDADSRYSPAQRAAVLVYSRSVEAHIDRGLEAGLNKGPSVSARLVVPSNQVGCLLGIGGVLISEIRKATGASIYVLKGDQVPKCVAQDEEVVEISGQFVKTQDALYHVTSRLRDSFFTSKAMNIPVSGTGKFVYDTTIDGRAADMTPMGLRQSSGTSLSIDGHATLRQELDPSLRPYMSEYSPSVGLRTSEAAGVNPRSFVTLGRGLASANGGAELGRGLASAIGGVELGRGLASANGGVELGRGLASANGGVELGRSQRPPIVTNTRVEMSVPEGAISSVYGENGSNLTRIRQISGAKVIVHEALPGSRHRTVVISGTPDETQAAQSLLHAFILTGSS